MSEMKKRTAVDEKVFCNAKKLLNSGVTQKDVAEIIGIGLATVTRIKEADNLSVYRENIRERARKNKKQDVVVKAPEIEQKATEVKAMTYVSPYQANRIIELLNTQNEILKAMSAKLIFIVDELTK